MPRTVEQDFSRLIDNLDDMIVIWTLDGRIMHANPAVSRKLGYPVEELVAMHIPDLYPGEKRTEAEEILAAILRNERDTCPLPLVSATGRLIYAETRIWRGMWNDSDAIIGVFKDFPAEREAEIERMKNEFVATVSHELRTPLTSIQGFIDLILEGDTGEISGQQREFLQIVLQDVDRLTAIISDLLDIERIETGRISLVKKRVSLNHLADQAAKSMLPMAQEKGVVFTVTVEKDLEIEADPDGIQQIFSNLISNAIKFTPSGSVTVDIRLVGRHAVMSFRDTGIGIEEKDIPNLFTRFFRAKDARERNISGTGLGLSIVKSLVEMHGGTITIHSTPGSGSEFVVILPARGSKGDSDR